jgi:hypothetical protein
MLDSSNHFRLNNSCGGYQTLAMFDMPNFGGFSRFPEHHLSVLYPYRHKKSTERFR